MNLYSVFVLVVGMMLYLLTSNASRRLQDKGFSQLDDAKRSEVFQSFSLFRKINVGAPLLFFLLYLLLFYLAKLNPWVLNIGLLSLFFSYGFASLWFIRRRLIRLSVPPSAVFSVLMGLVVQYIGMVIVIAAIVLYFLLKKYLHH